MVFDPAARTDREGRFQDPGMSNSVEQGLHDVTAPSDVSKKYIKRNLRPYKLLRKKKYPAKLAKLRNVSESRIERMAVKAVLKKHNITQHKLRRNIGDGYKPQKIRRAKRMVKAHALSWHPKNKVVKHVQRVMQNRRIMKTNIWKGKGYDIRKGYR